MIDIIIQGALYGEFTLKTAKEYAKIPEVNKVIISTWEDQPIEENMIQNDKIILLKNKLIENGGPGNMNYQIVSSREGISNCHDGLILKTRTDQHLYTESLYKWLDYFRNQQFQNTLRYTDGEKQRSKVYLIGNNKRFPFHPQDHFFLGYKQDVERVFDLQLWEKPSWTWKDAPINFSERLRPNIYLGINYYMKFFPEIEKFFKEPELYLLDGSQKYEETMKFYSPIMNSIFSPLPRIDMWWAKQNTGYWYSYEKEGEYYAD
jgi:hypothetical protein